MTAELPPELAPSLRAAAEQLLAECRPALHREHGVLPDYEQRRKRCARCHRPGQLVLHRQPDDSTVEVHPGCRRKMVQADYGKGTP